MTLSIDKKDRKVSKNFHAIVMLAWFTLTSFLEIYLQKFFAKE